MCDERLRLLATGMVPRTALEDNVVRPEDVIGWEWDEYRDVLRLPQPDYLAITRSFG